jgi:hypothetical protein
LACAALAALATPTQANASEPPIPCGIVKLLVEPASGLSANARVAEYSSTAGRAIETSAFGCAVASEENKATLRERARKANEAIPRLDNPQWAFIARQSMALLALERHWSDRNGEGDFNQNALLAASTSLDRFDERAIPGTRNEATTAAGGPLLFARMSFQYAPPAFQQWQRVIALSFGNADSFLTVEAKLQQLLDSPGLACSYASTAEAYAHLHLARAAGFELGRRAAAPYGKLAELHVEQASILDANCPRDAAQTPIHGTMTLRDPLLP